MKPKATANDVIIGRNLRAARIDAGITQHALGKAVGITFQQVQKYELGRNRMPADRLAAIADALGVPLALLYAGTPYTIGRQGKAAAVVPLSNPEFNKLVRVYAQITDLNRRRDAIRMLRLLADT